MDVIGKVQASIAAASQETTIALANANFDMSLIRIEAPAEYKPLGMALSKSKRNVAEDGPAHVTARRLGSLFQSMLPETPNLIKAYGIRASEIAQSPVVNPKGTDAHGPFKDYVGVDGTSIWAAATSGSAAIAAHLLACFIATYWPADEATAIWVELVAERKRRLQAKAATAEYFDLSDTLSTKLELDQTHLANWDASARSWLRAAGDSPAVSARQKTVGSILDRLNIAVRGQQDLFTSVTEAWKLSLETMEKVITGSSYSIEDGSVVIALLAWHLYPDLIVLGSRTEDIPQNDDLVEPGGCITVGLRSHTLSHNDASGVHWSLSLAHLRYYGTPRPTSRSLTNTPSGNARFSREEFTLILIGVIIARWREESDVSVDEAMSFMQLIMSKLVELFQAEHSEQLGSWVKAFKSAFDEYEAADNRARSLARKLVNLGLRNQTLFKRFGPGPQQNHPYSNMRFDFLGLNSLHFARVLYHDDQKRFLQSAMQMLTRPYSKGEQPARKLLLALERQSSEEPWKECHIFTSSQLKGFEKLPLAQNSIRELSRGTYYIADIQGHLLRQQAVSIFTWVDPPKPIHRYLKRHHYNALFPDKNSGNIKFYFRVSTITSHFLVLEPMDDHKKRVVSGFAWKRTRQEIESYLSCSELNTCGFLELAASQPCFSVLRLISRMWDLYEHLPGCKISPNVLRCNLLVVIAELDSDIISSFQPAISLANAPAAASLDLRSLSHASGRDCAFKLLVVFEAGVDIGGTNSLSVSSIRWNDLVAVSTDDSLYINPVCLGNLDPHPDGPFELRRVRGNVGRPGLSLIGWFSESKAEWRQPSMDMWQVVNHNPFHGRLDDVFTGTSLHLKVTGWSRELDFGGGKCVPDGTYLEAIVSAYDTGAWLGDLTYPHIGKPVLHIISALEGCRGATPVIGTMPPEDLVIVENWEELLSPHPTQPAVVMCHGNWQARVTAISLSLTKGYRTVIFNGHGCWQCTFGLLGKLKRDEAKEVLKSSKKRRTKSNSDASSSDEEASSSNSEEEKDSNETDSPPKTTGDGRLVEDDEGRKEQEGGDDATLIDQGEASNSLAEDLEGMQIDEATDDSDSDSETSSSGSSSILEDDDRLEEILRTLPYKPTVFIL